MTNEMRLMSGDEIVGRGEAIERRSWEDAAGNVWHELECVIPPGQVPIGTIITAVKINVGGMGWVESRMRPVPVTGDDEIRILQPLRME